jgi:putative transposase
MPRTARSIAAGVYYHVINRGNNRGTVFREPREFDAFLHLMNRAQARLHIDVSAVCLMPNHFHMVVRLDAAGDLAAWVHWLLTSHASQHHKNSGSSGRIWTSRFKAFPVQDNRYLRTVIRYVERNALRANLVATAESWPWGSLHWRLRRQPRFQLSPFPGALSSAWCDFVNGPQTASELAHLRLCVNRGSPYGESGWVKQTAETLGLGHTLRGPGRPRRQAVVGGEMRMETALEK